MCFLMQYHPLLNDDHERLLSLAVKNPKHSCHIVDIVAAFSSFYVSSLLEFTLRAWRHFFVALSPSIPRRADLGNDKILFVPNIASCQGKWLNICTKLWCSSDFRFQRADPIVILCFSLRHLLHSKCFFQCEAHTCWASHSHTRPIFSTDRWMPEGGKHFIFPFGRATSFQSVRHFLSACLLENKFILLSHEHTHKHTCTHTIYDVLLELLRFYNKFKVRVPGWNSSCRRHWVSWNTWLSFQTNLFTDNLLKVLHFSSSSKQEQQKTPPLLKSKLDKWGSWILVFSVTYKCERFLSIHFCWVTPENNLASPHLSIHILIKQLPGLMRY